MTYRTLPVSKLQSIKGIRFPAGVRFRQLIITGPPGSGKSTLLNQIGGWPEEGYLDLSHNRWWFNSALSLRPREVHLGLPFPGRREALAVFDEPWLSSPSPVDISRVLVPPPKRSLFSTDWRRKYVFVFLLVDPERLYEQRRHRLGRGSHPVDTDITLEQVRQQVEVYESVALHLHQSGCLVFLYDDYAGSPKCFDENANIIPGGIAAGAQRHCWF